MPVIDVIPYQSSWPREFDAHRDQLLEQVGRLALRIDHIGSTAVPGLAAKDVIDIQIAVSQLTSKIADVMAGAGYRYHPNLKDLRPPKADPSDWQKQVFTEPAGARRVNIHVRRHRAANMRQALLFRDYLRAHPISAESYGTFKQRLAQRHPDDREFYYSIKDPVFEIVQEAAELWAETSGWNYDRPDSQ